MSVLAKAVAFNIGAGTGPLAITNVGFTPKAILFFANGRTEATAAGGRASLQRSMGFAAESTAPGAGLIQRSIASFQADAATSFPNNQHTSTAECIVAVTTSTVTTGGRAALQSMDADGFTLNRTEAFTSSLRVIALCLGGPDIAEVSAGDFTPPTSGTTPFNTSINTGIADTPDNGGVVFLLSAGGSTGDNATSVDSDLGFGWAVSVAEQACVAAGGDDAHAGSTLVTQHMDHTQIGVNYVAMSSLRTRASFAGWTATGFDLTWNELSSASHRSYWLHLRGGKWQSVASTLPGAGASVSTSGLGAEPAGGLALLTLAGGYMGDDVVNDGDGLSFGAWSDVADQHALGTYAATAVSPSKVATRYDPAAVGIVTSDTGATEAAVALASVDADGATYTTRAGATGGAASPFALLLVGPKAPATPTTTGRMYRLLRRRRG